MTNLDYFMLGVAVTAGFFTILIGWFTPKRRQ